MNITLAVDDKLVNDARKIASDMGKSLNQIIREYLENLTRQQKPKLILTNLSPCQDREIHKAGNSTGMNCMKERSFFDTL